jgi:hypothetical protein
MLVVSLAKHWNRNCGALASKQFKRVYQVFCQVRLARDDDATGVVKVLVCYGQLER